VLGKSCLGNRYPMLKHGATCFRRSAARTIIRKRLTSQSSRQRPLRRPALVCRLSLRERRQLRNHRLGHAQGNELSPDPIQRPTRPSPSRGKFFHFFSETPGRFGRAIRFLEGPYSVARGPNRVGVAGIAVAGSAVTGIGVAGIGVAGIGTFELHLFLLTHLGAWR
jgi:hypothetical protein